MKEICPVEQCTGCEACLSACAMKAITMHADDYGFYYPVINQEGCVDCGLCAKVCPNNSAIVKSESPDCFVGHARDVEEQLSSTSGGVASALARLVVKQGGVVYGCAALDGYDIRHIRIDKESDIALLKGSKYVQSRIDGIYTQVKSDLTSGKRVLFVGTPCQVAGLNGYLRKDYDNLITADFVCHGVPSVKFLKDSMGCKEYGGLSLSFRRKDRKKGHNAYVSQCGVYLKKDNDLKYDKHYPYGLYIAGFLHALFYRDSCYQCHYTTPQRVSDFTLGDYDDKENAYVSLSGRDRVVSMIMANTSKAKSIMEEISPFIEFMPCSLDIIVSKHEQLYEPMPKHKNYNLFRQLYVTVGFEKAVRICLNLKYSDIIKREIKSFVKHLPGVEMLYRKLSK